MIDVVFIGIFFAHAANDVEPDRVPPRFCRVLVSTAINMEGESQGRISSAHAESATSVCAESSSDPRRMHVEYRLQRGAIEHECAVVVRCRRALGGQVRSCIAARLRH